MRKITKRQKIKGVSDRWDKQYKKHSGDSYWKKQLDTGDKLRKLDLNKVSAKVVNEIIGNNSWTQLICDECEKDKPFLIRFLERYEDEYECNSCDVCKDCLNKAIELKLIKRRKK